MCRVHRDMQQCIETNLHSFRAQYTAANYEHRRGWWGDSPRGAAVDHERTLLRVEGMFQQTGLYADSHF